LEVGIIPAATTQMQMKVLVTGGTGYLGRAIVAALMRRGHDPVVFARHASGAVDLPCARIDGDVRDHGALREAVRGAGGVIHAAALVSVWQRDAAEFDRVNVAGLEALLDVCALERVPRIVVTSSFLALPPAGGRPLEANHYQRSKVRAREVARTAVGRGAPVITVIPGVIYGPGPPSEGNLLGRLFRDHLAGRLPGIIGADRLWSFSLVDDVAEAHVAALESGRIGEEYVTGGENLPQIRAFEVLRDVRGTPLPRRIPPLVARVLAVGEETFAVRWRTPQLTRGTVNILLRDWPLDSHRSVAELSYRVTPLKDGVKRMLAADI
jgi:NAD+-dependent farnesol dehydrogenase